MFSPTGSAGFASSLVGDKFVGILDAEHLNHLAMELREVVNLWSLRAEAPLGSGRAEPCAAVRITDGDHVHYHVVHLASTHLLYAAGSCTPVMHTRP